MAEREDVATLGRFSADERAALLGLLPADPDAPFLFLDEVERILAAHDERVRADERERLAGVIQRVDAMLWVPGDGPKGGEAGA